MATDAHRGITRRKFLLGLGTASAAFHHPTARRPGGYSASRRGSSGPSDHPILDTSEQLVALDAQTLDRSNSINVKGLGEPPLVGAGAAIANAIYTAIGARIRHYPITPDKVLR